MDFFFFKNLPCLRKGTALWGFIKLNLPIFFRGLYLTYCETEKQQKKWDSIWSTSRALEREKKQTFLETEMAKKQNRGRGRGVGGGGKVERQRERDEATEERRERQRENWSPLGRQNFFGISQIFPTCPKLENTTLLHFHSLNFNAQNSQTSYKQERTGYSGLGCSQHQKCS